MRLAAVVLCVLTVLVVSLTTGDAAPQWRPQGRFGKRFEPAMPVLLNQNARRTSYPRSYQEKHDKVDQFKVLLQKLCSKPEKFGFYPCSVNQQEGSDNSLQYVDLNR